MMQNNLTRFFLTTLFPLSLVVISSFTFRQKLSEEEILSYIADPKKQDVRLYWKDDSSKPLKSIQRLKQFVEGKGSNLVFAMNAGMYMEDNSPLGLFIKEGKEIKKINPASASGNFYMKPNGVFSISLDRNAKVGTSGDFEKVKISYATQSGPMLVIDGRLHHEFTEGSKNLNIRNGVGILPDGRILFAMSKEPVNFYDFAFYFFKKGCKNALYLDGFVSRTYLPEKSWVQTDGNFGVMIGITSKK